MKLPIYRFCLLIGSLASCSMVSVADSVGLQEPPDGWVAADSDFPERWNIRWLGTSGREHSCSVNASDLHRINLDLPRERAVVVLAEPISAFPLSGFVCTPAGVVLSPGSPRPSRLMLSWENGFAASILLNLVREGVAPEAFNLTRFIDLCVERSGGNPWKLDRRRLIGDMLSGQLRVYSFSRLAELEIELELPISGLWYSDYPLELPIDVVSGYWSGLLGTGLHRFSMGTHGPSAEVSVDSGGRATVFFNQ